MLFERRHFESVFLSDLTQTETLMASAEKAAKRCI